MKNTNGVDLKRTAGAILNTLMGNSSYGGSTITQQLVKNITKDDATTGMAGIFRKIKEWAKAYQVERMLSKNQILELYLNILYIGKEGNLHGVELGAQYYFNKSAKDLDLAECAYLAGINSSPNYYNPYSLSSESDTEEKRTERIKNKTITVLNKMKELGYIKSEEEYNAAVEKTKAGLPFQKGQIATASSFSYHTDALIEQVIEQVMEEKEYSRQMAENYVYGSGLTIYSTVNDDIQSKLEEEYAKPIYKITSPSRKQTSQSGTAVIDYKTGKVVGVVGGLGEKETGGWNRATQMKKQPGSSIKPIVDIAPALQEKVITAATTYYDVETKFGTNYTPKNDAAKYDRAPMNIRRFIAVSRNIPAVKIMTELTPEKGKSYLKKFGYQSIDDKKDTSVTMSIGGLTVGVSPLEMAAAYGTIANGGVYITPTFYSKVVDSEGTTVLTPKQENIRVISEQNAYIVTSIAQEPLKAGGTATYCTIPGIDVAAKTGTTDNSYDRWLAGFTPYYSSATWFGYDSSEEIIWKASAINPAGLLWSNSMKAIHKGLPNAQFTKPDGIVTQTVCTMTGGLATTGCPSYTEIFTEDNMPEKCQGHGSQSICSETEKLATEYCSQYCEVKSNAIGAILPKEKLGLWTTIGTLNSGSGEKIDETCTVHTKPKETEAPKPVEQPKEPNDKNQTTDGNTTTSGNSTTGGNTTTGGEGTTGGNAQTPSQEEGNTENTEIPREE